VSSGGVPCFRGAKDDNYSLADPASDLVSRPRFSWEVLSLTAFVVAVYFSRLDAIPFRGEETRWARVAWEMRETGDYIVPRQQGQVFPDRPPLNSWCMLAASRLTGGLDRLSVRLPAALATLLTTLMVYGYCCRFLSRFGAWTAGLVYATFPQTLQLGGLAESDAVFTCLMAAAVLVWHTGYLRCRPHALTWMTGYALAALAGLAKGPQGPIYFVATVVVYLGLKRDWRYLFSLSHAAGLLVFAAVLGAWQVPFSLNAGANATAAVWSEEGTIGNRLAGIFAAMWWRHLASYPAEVLLYLLPWSVFLFWYLRSGSWRSQAAMAPQAGFLAVYLAIAFASCWLVTEARPRHLMAVYPAVACLIGLAIDRSCFSRDSQTWDGGFRWFLMIVGAICLLLGAAVATAGFGLAPVRLSAVLPSSWSTVACGTTAVLLAAVCLWAQAGRGSIRAAVGIAAVGATLGISFATLGVGHFSRLSDDLELQVARLKTDVVRGQRLVSLGPLFHKFTFYYQDPIEIVPWPDDAAKKPPGGFFCFMEREAALRGKLPFAWQEVAVLYCDRAKQKGINIVHVGRPSPPR